MEKSVNCVLVTNTGDSMVSPGVGVVSRVNNRTPPTPLTSHPHPPNNNNSSSSPSTSSKRKSLRCPVFFTSLWALVATSISILLAVKLHLSTFYPGDHNSNICLTEACVRTAASLLGAMNVSADPCDDFFQFACGNWNKKHMIPEDRASISTFEVLSDQIQLILKGLLEEPVNELDSEATIKAKDFYISCMNLSAIREEGLHPLTQLLEDLGGWPVTKGENWEPKLSPEVLIGRIRSELNMGVLVELWIGPDDTNSSNNIIQVDQMQLGLPSRDYFLNTSRELIAYHLYMTELSVLFNASYDYAYKDLQEVLAFEIALANVTIPEADRQDTSAIYRKDSLASLARDIPEFNWTQYFQTFLHDTTLDEDEPIVSYAFPYLKDLARIIKETKPRVVQNYVIWRVLMEFTAYLVDKFQEAKIEFRQVLMGVTSERHRWHQCVEWTNKKLGMALGALFIRDNFDPIAKETAQEMISNIRDAFIELLDENHWMDAETRKVAKHKAVCMNERIGYPDFLTKTQELNKEYQNLTVSRNQFVHNIIDMGRWKAYQNSQKLRKPVDKNKWSTEPAVVNAFYDPNKNDIVFPAGILQPLFYSQHFPKSLNYGGIGVVIGHEITHGFDDKGRQFDSEGNLKEWWNNETIAAFRKQTQCIIDQYSGYRIDDHRINGRMTQGENIADNGGLKQAYRAFKKWERTHGLEKLLPGLEWMTHDQYFFLNYAQIWCGSMRPEDLLSKIRSAVHAPAPIRVLGPLSNSYDFTNAYSCKPQAPMNPKRKCSVW